VTVRLCRFDDDRFGLLRDGAIHDVTKAVRDVGTYRYPLPTSDPMIAGLDALRPLLERAANDAAPLPLAGVKLRNPVANPSKLICAPVNYAAHLAEGEADSAINFGKHVAKIREVALFLKARSALAGAGDGIALRNLDRRNDHEIELALVIGRAADRVPEERAMEHVAGYTIGLDITTRGPEDRSFRKSSDTYAVLGPWLVTADEIDDPAALDLVLHVNGAERQRANTRDLAVGMPELIAWASRCYTLLPGDVIYTGTPAGVGPIVPGDVISASITGIGEMEVAVRAA
jgi:2-keto-4-pentenoate hydratase/2-oxohepta-3-ene-1,7-dioic acid hydratase in catechol pathway